MQNKNEKKQSAEFDKFANNFDNVVKETLGIFGSKTDFAAEYKIQSFPYVSFKEKDTPLKILEFGCGTGRNLPYLKKYYPKAIIYGCDISEKSLEEAQKILPDLYSFLSNDINTLKEYFETFDIVFLSCVLHHIPLENRQEWISAISKTLSSSGVLYIFELNPYNPVTRHIFNTCPFDQDEGVSFVYPKDCFQLLKEANLDIDYIRYTLLFPFQQEIFRKLEKLFYKIPLGAHYCATAYKK